MSAERQKEIYEAISAVRDALPTEVAEELLHDLVAKLAAGVASSQSGATGQTLRRWLEIEVE